jgi:hypothetical protein
MNEQILRELINKATDCSGGYIAAHFDREKFAKLIIQECIDTAFAAGDDVAYLKKHFGVK